MSFKSIKNNSRLVILALLSSICVSLFVSNNSSSSSLADGNTLVSWDFSDNNDCNAWQYSPYDEVNYSGNENSKLTTDGGMLVLSVNYSNDSEENYSQTGISYCGNKPLDLQNCTKATFDFIYDSNKLNGNFLVRLVSNECNLNKLVTIDTSKAETYSDALKRLKVNINFDPIQASSINELSIQLIGNKTSYNGDIRFDNIAFLK